MQRNSPVMLATIVLGLLALGATAFMLLGPKGGPTPPPGAVAQAAIPTPTPSAHWVASRDIPPRTVVLPAMMRRSYASGVVPAGAVQSLDDLAGQITREPIGAGETVRLSSFTQRLHRAVDANIEIPAGYRGVAIWVDPDQTAAGLVDVGDRIDVISTHKLTFEKGPRQYVVGAVSFTAGRTIAQDLLVLGVNKSINAPAPTPTPVPGAAGGPPAGGDGAPAAAPGPAPTPVPPPPPTGTRTRVLVAALPETAARLVAANDQGLLHVTIRNPSDGDAGLIPEAREYPSRVITMAPEVNPTVASAERGMRSMERASQNISRPPLPMPELPQIQPVMPAAPRTSVPRADNMGGTGMAASDAMGGKEITVIRGTEKTRVIVPQR